MADRKRLEGIIVRRATHADYDAVMQIDTNIYDGLDYLPAMYHHYIDDKTRNCFVLEKDGKVLAYTQKQIIDDGTTMSHQAARVNPTFRGQGLITTLSMLLEEQITNYSKIAKHLYTSTNWEFHKPVLKQNTFLKLIVRRPRVSVDFSNEELKHHIRSTQFVSLMRDTPFQRTICQTPSSAYGILSEELDIKAILPENVWIINWEPYGTYNSNYEIICKECTVFVTRDGNSGKIVAISFGSIVPVKFGIRHRVDFYCHQDHMQNEKIMLAHILKHLIHLKQREFSHKHISFSVLHPECYPGGKVKDILKSCLGMSMKISSKMSEETALLLEYDQKDAHKFLKANL